ncbi:hypothetical protein BC835DRAFT_1390263 [Cytidiella melzeri]|nr:hypothetical protein BC835DRAFT_1390263 [Cytidiella melzeri]
MLHVEKRCFAKAFRDGGKEAQARSERAGDVGAGEIRCVMAWRWQNLRPEEDLRSRRGRDTEICPLLCTHCYQLDTEVDMKKVTGGPCGIYLVVYNEVLVPDACLLWYEQFASRILPLCIADTDQTTRSRPCNIVIQIRCASPGLDVEGRLNGVATSYAVTPRIATDSDTPNGAAHSSGGGLTVPLRVCGNLECLSGRGE